MAMFLSRIKQILNLGTKSITANGTYNASTDGYDGYSSVEVNVPSVTPTSITPSNWSPAEMTAGNAYTPSANALAIEYGKLQQATPSNSSPFSVSGGIAYNIGPTSSASGYLIESYSSITPSNSSPATITSGSIYKASANGKAVASVTDVTPSSTPTSVSANDVVKFGGSGVIVDSIPTPTSITPSNSSPVALTANTPVNPTASGYAISSYSSKTPSDSSPASVSSGAIIKASANGYLYSTQQPKVKTGTFTTSTSATTSINCGFKPKYLAIEVDGPSSSGTHMLWIYNQDTSTSSCYYASASNYPTTSSLPSTSNNRLGSIDSNGFTFNLSTSRARTARYFAIG